MVIDVLTDAVAAPGAAAERGGRIQAVVHRAAETGAADLIDRVAGNVYAGGDVLNVLQGVGVDHAAVTGALHIEVRTGDLHGVLPLVIFKERQNGAELFLGQNVLIGDALGAAENDAGILWDGEAGHLADGGGGGADDILVQRAVGEHGLAQDLGVLFVVDDIGARGLGQLDDLGALLSGDDHVLLAGAENAVIEGAARDDHFHDFLEVHITVDHDLHVALTDADGRLAAGIGSLSRL